MKYNLIHFLLHSIRFNEIYIKMDVTQNLVFITSFFLQVINYSIFNLMMLT